MLYSVFYVHNRDTEEKINGENYNKFDQKDRQIYSTFVTNKNHHETTNDFFVF